MKAGTKRRAREAAAAAAAAREAELSVLCRCRHRHGEHAVEVPHRCLGDWDEGFCQCLQYEAA